MNNLPTLHEIKLKLANERLEMFAGNPVKAAKSLGVSHSTMLDWIKRFDELEKWRIGIKRGGRR